MAAAEHYVSRREDPPAARLPAVDVLRGAVMVLMALDHARDYVTSVPFEPEDLQHTWLALFLTRWVTHFCAPLFFFLAGVGAALHARRHSPAALRRFLWTRGLWLVVLEATLVGFAWTFRLPFGVFGVLSSLGVSMLLLALLVRLPERAQLVMALLMVALHDLADGVRPRQLRGLATVWSLLHVKGGVAGGPLLGYVLFPIVPWCAVMALGCLAARWLGRPAGRARLLWTGAAMTLLFVLLRATNLYGNPPALAGGVTPGDWSPQPTLARSLILFLDTEKYPPSLQFLLMTLGPSLLALAWLDARRRQGAVERWLEVYGRVPLFFYVLHLFLVHLLAIALALLSAQPVAWLWDGAFWRHDLPAGYGHGLPIVYLVWALAVVLLYPACRWFGALKRRRRDLWLSYL